MATLRSGLPPLIATCVLCALPVALGQTPEHPEFRDTWFAPALVENNDPICPLIFDAARETFPSGEEYVRIWPEQHPVGPLEPVSVGSLPTEVPADPAPVDYLSRTPYIENGANRVYLGTRRFPGCGGGCETYALLVSDRAIPQREAERQGDTEHIRSTPPSTEWALYRDSQGNYFTLADDYGSLQVFRIVPPEKFALSCSISLAPRVRESKDADVIAALASLDALERTTDAIAGGSGDCGTLRTAQRLAGDMHSGLEEALYRAWVMPGPSGLPGFSDWGLQGILEYRAVEAFRKQYAQTKEDLATFYVRKNGWTRELSLELADRALGSAINMGFSFGADSGEGMSEPERRTRAAILEHRPLSEIRAISASVSDFDSGEDDGIASVAIEYPEALRDLLARGANPNQANAFGKTPLMYAAQYDRVEAARILLEHGADPNARTTRPVDNCNFTLERSRVTPLHYAARYASADMIRLLLKSGAVTFAEATVSKSGLVPLDWLSYYTNEQATERNPNITAEEIPALVESLRVPDEAKRRELSRQLTLQAETQYAKGRVHQAYGALRSALAADHANLRARRNLALVALRTNHLGEAAELANTTMQSDPSTTARADAWFNMGLICEQYGSRYLNYDGWYYCIGTPLHAYLEAWRFAPTTARRTKIEQTFQKADANDRLHISACDVPSSGSAMQRFLFTFADDVYDLRSEPRQRIYVYHSRSDSIDAESIAWDATFNEKGSYRKAVVHPRVTDRYDLGAFAVTELDGDQAIQGTVAIGAHTCPDPRK